MAKPDDQRVKTLEQQRVKTLEQLRTAKDDAADSEKKGWGSFIAAQEALVQQDREARKSLTLAELSIEKITLLVKGSLGDSEAKITQAVKELDDASDQVEKHQKEIAAEKAGGEAAEAEIKRLLGAIDERKKEIATALARVTKLRDAALAAAMSTTPDATRKAWAFIEELKKAKEKLSGLLSSAQKLDEPNPTVNEQNLTAYIKAAKANADLPNFGKALIIAQDVPEEALAEYLTNLLAAQKKAGDKLDKAKQEMNAKESARRHAEEVRKAAVQ